MKEVPSSEGDLLFSRETLDRSSPDLWPERIPGVRDFVAANSPLRSCSRPPKSSSRQRIPCEDEDTEDCFLTKEWNRDLDSEDMNMLQGFGSLTTPVLLDKVRELQDLAYQLGLEESREMTRGKFLDVLSRNDSLDYSSVPPLESNGNAMVMTPLSSPISSIQRGSFAVRSGR